VTRAVLLLALLAGCATPSQVPVALGGRDHGVPILQIGQSGTGPAVVYVACPGGCAGPTEKVVATVEPVAAAAVLATLASPQARYTVQFERGSRHLDAAGVAVVAQVVGALHGGEWLSVIGRTDPTGSARANLQLALSRAQAVRHALIAAGVAPAHVRAARHAPCCDAERPSALATMRRADILIVNAEGEAG
jgi:outer membrane protein OmpA-like peptidoglycan-associated protein